MAYDITELQAVDFALGAVVANAFTEDPPSTGAKNYIRFLERPVREKIYRADHDDAASLIRKIAADKKGDGSVAQTSGNHLPELPIVCYFRKPGISSGDDKVRMQNKTVFTDDTLSAYKLSILPVSLDYTLRFVAWDTLCLDKMALAWYAYIARAGRKNSRFIVPSKVGDDIFELPANFSDPRTVDFSDSSEADKRLYSLESAFTITTHVLAGEGVTPLSEIEVQGITTSFLR